VKVADFGLSKLAPQTGEHHLQVSTQMKGTLVSFMYNLFSTVFGRTTKKVQEVRTALDKGSLNAVLASLDPMQTIEPVLDLALMCMELKSVDCPSMNLVVKSLEAIAVQNHVMAGDANQ
jgi:hypothetical protein